MPPRHSGKTTCLTALTGRINSEGEYYALYCSLASLSGINDRKEAMGAIVGQINKRLLSNDVDELRKLAYAFDSRHNMADADVRVQGLFNDLCLALDRELVVFFDEADCIGEDPLNLVPGPDQGRL
ncbi:MAG: hypothetical protein LBR80_17775 [Deltaproteobacteria bacterium]|jgi:hypothetical protein|nr:hypothetical protein [Deltaproteobacteria bacterium]